MRCKYCGKDTEAGRFCSEKCRSDFEAFESRVQRQRNRFFVCFAISIVLPVAIMFVVDADLAALLLMIVFLGLTFMIFPFCTPEAAESFSLKTSIRVARGLGAAMVVVGLMLMLFCMDLI